MIKIVSAEPKPLFRYTDFAGLRSYLDPFEDVLSLTLALRSTDYLVQTIKEAHGFSTREANNRAKKITPHVDAILGFVEQSQSGPKDSAFLPGYYAILNALKIYILLGPYHSQLPKHRWHGASYDGYAKNSHDLMTEEISLKTGGAIPLFYQTVTGTQLPAPIKVKMRDVFPFIRPISFEYTLATGNVPRFAVPLAEVPVMIRDGVYSVRIVGNQKEAAPTAASIQMLKSGWRRDQKDKQRFILSGAVPPKQPQPRDFDPYIQRFLIYHPLGEEPVTPISKKRLLMPEELPIALMFFHMSNVVRYKPEFLARLKDSRHWPALLSALRHCILHSLILLWSFVHQKTLHIQHDA